MEKGTVAYWSFVAALLGLALASLIVVLSFMLHHQIGGLAHLWYLVLAANLGALILGVCSWQNSLAKAGAALGTVSLLALCTL